MWKEVSVWMRVLGHDEVCRVVDSDALGRGGNTDKTQRRGSCINVFQAMPRH